MLGSETEADDAVQEAWLWFTRATFVPHDMLAVPFEDVGDIVGRSVLGTRPVGTSSCPL
jgi:hypothetical protein